MKTLTFHNNCKIEKEIQVDPKTKTIYVNMKISKSPQTNQTVQQGRGDGLANNTTIADVPSKVKTEDTSYAFDKNDYLVEVNN